MILQQLYNDSASILENEMPPAMYDWQVVRWIIDVTLDGQLKSITPLGDKYGVRHLLPYNYGRSVDIVPNLLTDLAKYALGVIGNKADEKHRAFRSLLTRCSKAVNEPQIDAVIRFLETGGVSLEEATERGIQ